MARTLDTLAEKITALTETMLDRFGGVDRQFMSIDTHFQAIDDRFQAIDDRFQAIDNQFKSFEKSIDQRFDELESGLRTQIEAVDAKVGFVLEKMDQLIQHDVHHSAVHARFDVRLDNHEIRLTALEAEKRISSDEF